MDKKQEALKLVQKMARICVEKNANGWPPGCMGFLHQPKRPGEAPNNLKKSGK